ncbi:hypothetical protein BDW66DRAFT_145331 [Aspergillus desertorum]
MRRSLEFLGTAKPFPVLLLRFWALGFFILSVTHPRPLSASLSRLITIDCAY